MPAEWFYTRKSDQHRGGPVSREQLHALLASGEVGGEDLVWTVGMPQWSPAAAVPALGSGSSPIPVASAAVPSRPVSLPAAGSPIAYYTGGAGMPPRAAAALRGHASPRGDVGDWPLDDGRISQFEAAVKVRKRISGAAQLYRSLLFLAVVATAIIGLLFIVAAASGFGRRGPGLGTTLVPLVMVAALSVLYYFTWKATAQSHRWAPLTMFIVFMVGVVANLLLLVLGSSTGRFEALFPGLLGMVLPAIFSVVSWRAYSAIPRYLASPAWCQELVVKAGL